MSNPRATSLLLLFVLLVVGCCHAGTIQYLVTNLGAGTPPLDRYTYYLTDVTLLANQEVDIVFSAASYGTLSNGVTGSGLDLVLLQPGNPLGAPGHFSAMAETNIGLVQGSWSVDFVSTGTGQPGSQSYFINQYDANGRFLSTLDSGSTQNISAAPEPGTFLLLGLAVLGCGVGWVVRRRNARTAPRVLGT
jgi:hypothetical protein